MKSRESTLIDQAARERDAVDAINRHIAELTKIRKSAEDTNHQLGDLAFIKDATHASANGLTELAEQIRAAARTGSSILSESRSAIRSARRTIAFMALCALIAAVALLLLVLRGSAEPSNSYRVIHIASPGADTEPAFIDIEVEMQDCFVPGDDEEVHTCEGGKAKVGGVSWEAKSGASALAMGDSCTALRSIRNRYRNQHLLILLSGGHDTTPLSRRAVERFGSNHNLAWRRAQYVASLLQNCGDRGTTILSVAGGASATSSNDEHGRKDVNSTDRRVRMQVIGLRNRP